MKTAPVSAPRSVSASEVFRTGAESVSRAKLAPRPAAVASKAKPDAGGVLRVASKSLGYSIPCASPAVAAQVEQFFKR